MTARRPRSSRGNEELTIPASVAKPLEISEENATEPMVPCGNCGRNFSAANLSRHTPICERLSQKPKRQAFKAIVQRLAHVAQESAIQPVIQDALHAKPSAVNSPRPSPPIPTKSRSHATRTGNAGADLFHEQQKGKSERKSYGLRPCPCCDRSFRTEAFDRHVEFCEKQQSRSSLRSPSADPKADLFKRRMKYRPPLPKSGSKERRPAARKAQSATHTAVATSMAVAKSLSTVAPTNVNRKSNGKKVAVLHRTQVIEEIQEQKIISRVTVTKAAVVDVKPDAKLASKKNHHSSQKNPKSHDVVSSVLQPAGDACRTRIIAPEKYTKPEKIAMLAMRTFPADRMKDVVISQEDLFLRPAVSRTALAEWDGQRYFHRVGGTYCLPPAEMRSVVKLSDIIQAAARDTPCASSSSTSSGESLVRTRKAYRLHNPGRQLGAPCARCGQVPMVAKATFCYQCGSSLQ